jgi:hypothetical protein
MNKGIRNFNSAHIRDVSHTLGMLMERVYSKEEEFCSYMKELAQVKFRQVMNPAAYLLPPKQRSIARFLNLSQIAEWSDKLLTSYPQLTAQEREVFSFMPLYASFIDELRSVLSCVNAIERAIKQQGLSHKALKRCMRYVKRDLLSGNSRMHKVAEQVAGYLNAEAEKLPSLSSCWNASSDVIESIFGVYKDRKSHNPLHGVTPFVLLLPLHTRIGRKDRLTPFDFKRSLEAVSMSDIDTWRKENLPENQVYKRIKILKAA